MTTYTAVSGSPVSGATVTADGVETVAGVSVSGSATEQGVIQGNGMISAATATSGGTVSAFGGGQVDGGLVGSGGTFFLGTNLASDDVVSATSATGSGIMVSGGVLDAVFGTLSDTVVSAGTLNLSDSAMGIDERGLIKSGFDAQCDSDEDALDLGRRMTIDWPRIEVWRGTCRLGCLDGNAGPLWWPKKVSRRHTGLISLQLN